MSSKTLTLFSWHHVIPYTFILFLYVSNITSAYCQKTIKGRLIDQNLNTVPSALVYVDTTAAGVTDGDGYFEIKTSINPAKVTFRAIGFEPTSINIPSPCTYVEVVLFYYVNYHYKSHRRTDRVRKREFKKTNDIHTQALHRGIFTNDTICYSRYFEYFKPELDKIRTQKNILLRKNKKGFISLTIGDTIAIPYSAQRGHNGSDTTSLYVFSSAVNIDTSNCLIKAVVIKKHRKRQTVIYKVINIDACPYGLLEYNGRPMRIGETFKHEMKFFNLITR